MGVCALRSELTSGLLEKPRMLPSSTVQKLAEALTSRQQTLFVLEASAGGVLQAALSARPGASRWLLGGLNCYHDSIKTGVLGLDPQVLVLHGAVSEPAVAAMAQRALAISGADWVLVESGVYGPAGGSPQKPVGLVISGIGRSSADSSASTCPCQRHQLEGGREAMRMALPELLLSRLNAAIEADDLAGPDPNLR